jgi:WD40 repeat protein
MTSPFKFLDSYTKDDRDIFFGRDSEIEELYHRVFESKIMLVYGVSGTGKSSLIQCGLANKFAETDWLPIAVRRGGNIIESMSAGINSASLTTQPSRIQTPQDFRKSVRSLYLDHYKPIFFIFDQFEELFIFGDREERKAFISIVKLLTESELQCRFIFVMREEYMAGFTEFERVVPSIFQNRVRIEKMSHRNAIEAIKGPCRVFNISLEEGFAEALLNRLSPENADVELTYLQVFLDKIYRLAPDKFSEKSDKLFFTIELLQKTGNVSDLLGSFLDEQIFQMDDPDTSLTVLKSFVSVRGTKRQMNTEDITEYSETLGKPVSSEDTEKLIRTFINLRILNDKDQNGKFEFRHDALAYKIYEKITLFEKEILEVRQYIENAWHIWLKRNILLSIDDLEYIAPYENRLHLPRDLSGFIEKSKHYLTRVTKRRRNLVFGLSSTLVIILTILTIWALGERNKARNERNKALAEKYNFLARDLATNDPTKALFLASYAYTLDTTNINIHNNLEKIYYDNTIYSILFDRGTQIESAVFFPDGKKMLVSTNDNSIWIVDLQGNSRLILTQKNSIRSLAIAADTNYFLTGSDDNIARLYEISGNLIQEFRGHSGSVRSVAFSEDGKYLLTGSNDNTARIWDYNGNTISILSGHTDIIRSAVFSKDTKFVATGSFDHTARLWDISGKLLQVLKGPPVPVGIVKFSPDGSMLVAACASDAALLWNINGDLIQQIRGHNCSVSTVDFSPDGQYILTGSCDNTCRLCDLNGNIIKIFKGHNAYVSSAFFSPDGKNIVTLSGDNKIRLWEVKGIPEAEFRGHTDQINCVAFSPNSQNVITGSKDNSAILWDRYGNILKVLKGHTLPVTSVEFSPDGNKILTGSDDKTARLWDESGKTVQILKGHTNSIIKCVFSENGDTVYTASTDNTVRLWNLDGELIKLLKIEIQGTSFTLSINKKRIYTASPEGLSKLYDLNGNIINIFKGLPGTITAGAFSPLENNILIGSDDLTARLCDFDGNVLKIFSGYPMPVSAIAFSRDGQKIITVSEGDNSIRLWNQQGSLLLTLNCNSTGINDIKFSPDGKEILAGSIDKTARLWFLGTSFNDLDKSMIYRAFDTKDRLSFKTTTYSEIIESGNEKELSEAADYYFQQAGQSGAVEEGIYLKYAGSIYRKLSKEYPSKNSYNLSLFKSDIYLHDLEPSRKVKNEIDWIENELRNYSNTDDLLSSVRCNLELYRFKNEKEFSDNISEANKKLSVKTGKEDFIKILYSYIDLCQNIDPVLMDLGITEYLLDMCDKCADNRSIYEPWLNDISQQCSDISYNLLLIKEFTASLKAAEISVKADSSNQYVYTNLPLAYIFNNRFEEANKLYEEYKDKQFTKQQKTYRGFFISDIERLESKGINHPDFLKVKQLLK